MMVLSKVQSNSKATKTGIIWKIDIIMVVFPLSNLDPGVNKHTKKFFGFIRMQ